jgi:Na+-driven multidrug efflux pump
MAFSMVTLWFCREPAVYYLAIVRDLGPTGIWLGVAIGHIIGVIGAGLWFTRETWNQAVIGEPATDSRSSVED